MIRVSSSKFRGSVFEFRVVSFRFRVSGRKDYSEAHRRLYHPTLGVRVIKKRREDLSERALTQKKLLPLRAPFGGGAGFGQEGNSDSRRGTPDDVEALRKFCLNLIRNSPSASIIRRDRKLRDSKYPCERACREARAEGRVVDRAPRHDQLLYINVQWF